MVMIPLAQTKPGDRLNQDIHTSLGGLLMLKGRQLSPRDLDVLQAFMVKHIDIDRSSGGGSHIEMASIAAAVEQTSSSPEIAVLDQENAKDEEQFVKAWLSLAKYMSKMLATAALNRLPILELRQVLEQLLANISSYRPMSVKSQVVELLKEDASDYLINKSIAVCLTSYLIGQWCDYPSKEGMQIAMAGLLHDIGMIKIDEDILYKKTYLSESEKAEMKRHPQYGYEILRNVPAINDGVKLAALQHHERLDGSGYPLRVKADKIHSYAKIVAIADMFHAMTQDRVYKRAESPYVALEHLHEASFGKLEPLMVQTFIQKMTQLAQGTVVKLNDGRIGRIVVIDANNPTRPIVSINGEMVHLDQDKKLWIVSVVQA
ncbi:HD-GYP domain-containing protein [Paenibacillus sp. ACRRX]|uniref:HD-GYP domain-containing protein n=1 Tax=Paenibacillus sp. ACRRX TaxID=2918206 RepID=UPI001EF57C80|nr:HD-GYP domain-containing protein [Paenibacillus sp. ACRRX]MCG7408400.1 HD-GYP domain-containing protein [Paenibacillus sp. ACRRX]